MIIELLDGKAGGELPVFLLQARDLRDRGVLDIPQRINDIVIPLPVFCRDLQGRFILHVFIQGEAGLILKEPGPVIIAVGAIVALYFTVLESGCLLYTSPSPRDGLLSRMPSSA